MQRFVSFGTCRYLCFPHLGGSEPPRWVNWRQQRMNLLQTKGGFWLRTKKASGRGLEVIQIHIETTTTNCRFLMKPSKTMVLENFGIQRFLGNNFRNHPWTLRHFFRSKSRYSPRQRAVKSHRWWCIPSHIRLTAFAPQSDQAPTFLRIEG